MADLAKVITDSLGKDAYTYACNKHRGGENGKRGCRYEDLFFGFKAAEIANAHLGKAGAWPELRGQILGFVDDVVVAGAEKTDYFQLKNVQSISWTSGDHPLEVDFAYQYTVATALNEPTPRMHLVVANQELKGKLEQAVPEKIREYTTVTYFAYGETPNHVVLQNYQLQELLKPLSKNPNPTLDELEGVYSILIMSSFHFPDGAAVDEMLHSANKRTPNLLRAIYIEDVRQYLVPGFEEVLAAIPGLTYAFNKGFFSWSAFGMSEIFRTDCSSEQFKDFQTTVVERQPSTIDDFEELLP
jgi:hypothetical protein